jgi:integral membrane protein
MPPQPSIRNSVESTLRLFKVAANITGYFLLIITVLYVIRLANETDLWLGGPNGFLTFAKFTLDAEGFKVGFPETGVNITSLILIVHGWIYVFYLYTDFRLWSLLRWNLGRFLLIAAGGVVPFLSFIAERHYQKVAAEEMKNLEESK